MAEIAVSLAREKLLPLLQEKANLLMGVPKEFEHIKDELERIQVFLKAADKRAVAEGDSTDDGIKKWVKRLREQAFRIEDVIDEYMIYVEPNPRDPGCEALLCDIAHFIKTLIPRHRIASEIRDIKSSIHEIKEKSKSFGLQMEHSFKKGSSSSRESQNVNSMDRRRMAYRYIEEDQLVGFEAPRDKLIGWLVEEPKDPSLTVISVVGMGGLGKTTLAKKVFDNQKVIGHFDCHAWITVSQLYTVERLLREMLQKFYEEKQQDPPRGLLEMDRDSLVENVRSYLRKKRYVVLFDDVWNKIFWDDIESVMIDNKNGSRIFITTRNMDVAYFCKGSYLVKVHELQPLTREKSFELFCKMAFRSDFGGCCPKELVDISYKIVEKCDGLPLAIVAIAGILAASKNKNAFEWTKFSQNLSSELEKESSLTDITKILGLSYDDLPDNLKPCLLYFGIYPEDYVVNSKRLIRQWVAEGFVRSEKKKTLEEVAEQYLSDLISRNLVQVSSSTLDGKARSCRVHDLLHDMILKKFKDLSFCQCIVEADQSVSGMIRRLSIASNFKDLMGSTESSHVRSFLVFGGRELHPDFVRKIPTKYKSLKLLDYENDMYCKISMNFGDLINLKYLSFRRETRASLEISIAKLQNLETLDLRAQGMWGMPKGVSKLRKLRHLLGRGMLSTELKDGIGGMTSLQTLREVKIDDDGVELFTELGKLKQLRELGLVGVMEESGRALCYSINEMQHLEKLCIESRSVYGDGHEFEILDLHFISSPPPMLRKLQLEGKLCKLPEWIPELQNLVSLYLGYSELIDDALESLQNMPNLLSLHVACNGYRGENMHFQDGGFRKLKELHLHLLTNLNSISIHKGALHSLNKLKLKSMPQLTTVPSGIQYLEKLQVLHFEYMSHEFEHSIEIGGGKEHPVFKHLPFVDIEKDRFGGKRIDRWYAASR